MAKLEIELDPQDIHDEICSDPEFSLAFWHCVIEDPIKGFLGGYFLRNRLNKESLADLVDALDDFKKELLSDA